MSDDDDATSEPCTHPSTHVTVQPKGGMSIDAFVRTICDTCGAVVNGFTAPG